jgi:hypothetical protein
MELRHVRENRYAKGGSVFEEVIKSIRAVKRALIVSLTTALDHS